MIIFYVENENGAYASENGKRRFDKLSGQKVFDFLKSEKGKGRRFMKVNDDGELNKVYVEVPKDKVRSVRKDERHKQYLSDCRNASGYVVISMYAAEMCKDDCASGEELIADESCDVEQEALRRIDIETLRKALRTLTEEEMLLINSLYLCKNPVSERKLADMLNIPQKTLNYRKKMVLEKLKNFF